jgi:hypothetical protein
MSNPTCESPRMKLKKQFMRVPIQVSGDHQFTVPIRQAPPPSLPINDAIQIKAAEYWLKLGEADEALRELEKLRSTWNHPAAIEVRVAAIGVLRERSAV